ncbi:hypothetical protein ACFE04_016423 [Oxalis oulophora]
MSSALMNRLSASPSSDSSNRSELYAALNCYTDYADITLEELCLLLQRICIDNTAYGGNMWEWFDNDVLRDNWIADMNERKHLRLVNNSTTNLPLRMYKGRRSEGRPPNGERCCMKLLFGDTNEPNWQGILVLKLKKTLDKEVEAHNETKSVDEHLEEEVVVLRMEILALEEEKKKK